jgi:hypothetical protein
MANIRLKDIYGYLQKTGMADQIHIRNQEIVIYYWNRTLSDLIPAVAIHAGRIEQIYQPRSITPKLYLAMNYEVINDLDGTEGYVRDKRTNGEQ